jgi:rhamnose transport system permease protein
MSRLFSEMQREITLALVIAVLIAAISVRAPVFFTLNSLLGVLVDTSFLFMLALAQMAVILIRGIDLSIAANLALTGMVTGLLSRAAPDLPIVIILIFAIAIGLGLGLLNGIFVAMLKIPPIVATLGTLAIYRGLIFIVANGKWLTQNDMTKAFLDFPKTTFLGVPALLWTAILVAIGMWRLLNHTRMGRAMYALGGNPTAAKYCGVDPRRLQLFVFALSGAISGLCGYLWVARYAIAYGELALGYELTVIAACVIGGVSIAGGVGSVVGTLLGALFLGVLVNALPVINVSPFWQTALSGVVILAAVVINGRSSQSGTKIILPEARRAAGGQDQ